MRTLHHFFDTLMIKILVHRLASLFSPIKHNRNKLIYLLEKLLFKKI